MLSTLTIAECVASLIGPVPQASAAGSLTNPTWSSSKTAVSATAASYTYTFTTATSSLLLSKVTMTVPSGTTGIPTVGTVTPLVVSIGGGVSLAGTTLTYTFTSALIAAGIAVSIQINGLTNTPTHGSYTSTITTFNNIGTAVDSGTTTNSVTFTGSLTSLYWSASKTAISATAASYTYTFTTASSSPLSSVTMTLPLGTGGSPTVGTVTPAAVAAVGGVSLASTTLTYTFTSASITSGTAVSIQINGITNTASHQGFASTITTFDSGTAVDSGATESVNFTAGALTSPAWSSSSTAVGATGVSYIYTFSTASATSLSSITMTVPPGTAGTPTVGTVTPSSITNTPGVSLSGNLLTYSFIASPTIPSGTAVSIRINGLTNTSTPGSYTSQIVTLNGGNPTDSGFTPAVTFTGTLTLTSPASLTWAVTLTGSTQPVVDAVSADQQLTVDDETGTGAGWHLTVSATTFTNGASKLPDAGTFVVTGSITSIAATSAPTTSCVTSCSDTTTYPVAITTALAPTAVKIYDASAGSDEGSITLGGHSAANPLGWWVNVPPDARTGNYTSTVTLAVVSGP